MLHLSWHEHLDVDDQVPAVRGMQVRVNRYGTPASTNSTSPVTLSSDAYCSSVGGVSGVVTETLALAHELGLPTFEFHGKRFLRRLTLVIVDAVIAAALYPVFPPDQAASHALAWISEHPDTS